ncbi:MAG: tetratricopeptide repeat protein [Pirellulales bacterium]
MARRAILFAAMLLFVTGCGDSTPPTLTEQGLKELRSGQFDQAIGTCSEAIRQNPRDAEAYLYRGRAHHYRNAMGDPKRAVADFSEAIRLAPESSDAYYSRALVYRDLGETELAAVDDKAARAADGQLQQVYRRLPDPAPTATLAKPREDATTDEPPNSVSTASSEGLPTSEVKQGELYKRLKKRDEPKESPIERYRRLIHQSAGEPERDASPWGDLSTLRSQRLPQGGEPEGRLTDRPNPLGRALRPVPTSPFEPRVPSGVAADPNQPLESPFGGLQSPFGQRTPAPTGFGVQPVGPFTQRSPAPSGQQPRQFNDNLYSNPAVRPPFPRDYNP